MARNYKYLGIGIESAWGTEAAATDYIPVISMTPKTNPTYGKQETVAASYLRKSSITSEMATLDFEFYPNTEHGITKLLKCLLQQTPTTTNPEGAAYQHSYISDDALSSFTGLAGSEDLAEEPYTGLVMRSLELASDPGGYLTCRCSTLGEKKDADNTIASPTFSTVGALRHADLTCEIDGVDKSQYVGAVSVTINNNIREDAFTAGSLYLQNRPKHTRRTVELSIELKDYDAALRTAFHAHSTVRVKLTWVGVMAAGTTPYTIEVECKAVFLDGYDQPVNSRDIETHTFGGHAIYDNTDSTDTEVIVNVINTETSQ